LASRWNELAGLEEEERTRFRRDGATVIAAWTRRLNLVMPDWQFQGQRMQARKCRRRRATRAEGHNRGKEHAMRWPRRCLRPRLPKGIELWIVGSPWNVRQILAVDSTATAWLRQIWWVSPFAGPFCRPRCWLDCQRRPTHRVERAIVNSGFQRPQNRVVINLAPDHLVTMTQRSLAPDSDMPAH
jgi:hypothetical protein